MDSLQPVADCVRFPVFAHFLCREFLAVVSTQDADLAGQRWSFLWVSAIHPLYIARRLPRRRSYVYLHRVVASRVGIKGRVRFVNGETLDCRRENLRPYS